jgi:hypothetical protein
MVEFYWRSLLQRVPFDEYDAHNDVTVAAEEFDGLSHRF